MKIGIFAYYIIAALAFFILWPLQMHHWLGEAFMQKGMVVKGEIDYLEQRILPYMEGDSREEDVKERIDKDYDEVYGIFDKSIEFYPEYMETFYIVGRYYIDGGSYRLQTLKIPDTSRFEEGVRVLNRDIYMNPNYKWAHNNVGVLYDKLAQLAPYTGNMELARKYEDLARRHYEIALAIDPMQIFALYNLGTGDLRRGTRLFKQEPEEANEFLNRSRDYMRRCIEVQPNREDCYYSLAEAMLLQEDYVALVGAVEDYFAMMERYKKPVTSEFFYRTLASAYLKAEGPIPANLGARPEGPVGADAPPLTQEERAKRAEEILLTARKMLEANPKENAPRSMRGVSPGMQVARLLADTYLLQREYDRAAEEYEKIFQAGLRDPVVYSDLIRLYLRAGQPVRAREFLEQGLADPQIRELLYDRTVTDPSVQSIVESPWFQELRDRYGLPVLPSATGEAPAPIPGSAS